MQAPVVTFLVFAAMLSGAVAQSEPPAPPTGRKALVIGRGTEPSGAPSHAKGAQDTFLQGIDNRGNNPRRGWSSAFSYDVAREVGLTDTTPLPALFKAIAERNLGYAIVIQNGPKGAMLDTWGTAVDNGMMPFAAQGNNTFEERIESPPGLYAAVSVAGGETRNTTSYGPGVEFIDALANGDAAQSWANQVVAAKFARVLDQNRNYNIWDARQHLRQAASNWEAGWNERTGYGRVDLRRQVRRLQPGPPVAFTVSALDGGRRVAFSWRNFLQSDFAATVIQRRDGRVIYEGRGTNFMWRSDVNGDETFVYFSKNRAGETSRIESYQRRIVTNLNASQGQVLLVLGAPPTDDRVNLQMAAVVREAGSKWPVHTVFRKGNPVYDNQPVQPGGLFVALLPDVPSMVSFALTNDYKVLLPAISQGEGDLYQFKAQWDKAAAAGMLVVAPHHFSLSQSRRPEARRLSPARISSAIFVGAGTSTNRLSFGPGLECYDAPANPIVIGGGLLTQMDAAAAVAAKLTQILDANPNYNSWDARQHLRQSCDKYASGWVEDGGFGRPANPPPQIGQLDPAPPVEIQAQKAADGKSVAFSWQNFLQSSYAETVVQLENGTVLYSGQGTNFTWKSDLDGDATFRVLSRDKAGRLSRAELFSVVKITGLARN